MSSAKQSKIEEHWLNGANVSKSLGISRQAFNRWDVEPVSIVGRHKFYTVKSVLENRIAHKEKVNLEALERRGQVDESEEGSLEFERVGLIRAQRISQELKNDILEGRSVPVDIVREVLTRILVQVGGILTALPLNLKRKHPELEKRVIDSIQSEIIKHQNEAAKLDEYLDQAIDDVIEKAEGKA